MTNKKQRMRTRTKGWMGTRVEVCGAPIRPEGGGDFICLLRPKHPDGNLHATLAIDEDTNTILTLVLNEEEGTVQWKE